MKEFDLVALKKRRNDLAAGTTGTIVHVNVEEKEFIVEFCREDGSTRALEDISAGDLILVTAHEPEEAKSHWQKILNWLGKHRLRQP